MRIEAKEFTIKMTHDELLDIAFSLKSDILNRVRKNKDGWIQREHRRLETLKSIFYALGMPVSYQEIYTDADKICKEVAG